MDDDAVAGRPMIDAVGFAAAILDWFIDAAAEGGVDDITVTVSLHEKFDLTLYVDEVFASAMYSTSGAAVDAVYNAADDIFCGSLVAAYSCNAKLNSINVASTGRRLSGGDTIDMTIEREREATEEADFAAVNKTDAQLQEEFTRVVGQNVYLTSQIDELDAAPKVTSPDESFDSSAFRSAVSDETKLGTILATYLPGLREDAFSTSKSSTTITEKDDGTDELNETDNNLEGDDGISYDALIVLVILAVCILICIVISVLFIYRGRRGASATIEDDEATAKIRQELSDQVRMQSSQDIEAAEEPEPKQPKEPEAVSDVLDPSDIEVATELSPEDVEVTAELEANESIEDPAADDAGAPMKYAPNVDEPTPDLDTAPDLHADPEAGPGPEAAPAQE